MNSYKSFTLALEKAADLAKRDIKEIELIAVSKKKPVQNIIEVIMLLSIRINPLQYPLFIL